MAKNPSKRIMRTGDKLARRISNSDAEKVGEELAKLSGIPSASRKNRPKDDPYNQIGL